MIYLTEHIETQAEGIRIEANNQHEAETICLIHHPELRVLGRLVKEFEVTDDFRNN